MSITIFRGLIPFVLSVFTFFLGVFIERKYNDNLVNSPVLEDRSRGLVLYIELTKRVFDTGDKDMIRRYVEDSYLKRNALSKGANSEEFIYFWTDWETDVEMAVKPALNNDHCSQLK